MRSKFPWTKFINYKCFEMSSPQECHLYSRQPSRWASAPRKGGRPAIVQHANVIGWLKANVIGGLISTRSGVKSKMDGVATLSIQRFLCFEAWRGTCKKVHLPRLGCPHESKQANIIKPFHRIKGRNSLVTSQRSPLRGFRVPFVVERLR